MGAFHVWLVSPVRIGLRRRFKTTNGSALVAEGGRTLYLFDSSVVVRVDLETRDVAHCLPPTGHHISSVQDVGGGVEIEVHDGRGGLERACVRIPANVFVPGLGPVAFGRFPSAFP